MFECKDGERGLGWAILLRAGQLQSPAVRQPPVPAGARHRSAHGLVLRVSPLSLFTSEVGLESLLPRAVCKSRKTPLASNLESVA